MEHLCEKCNLTKIRVWTEAEETKCENNHDHTIGKEGCCRCNARLKKENNQQCNCCYCTFGDHNDFEIDHYEYGEHSACEHGFCQMMSISQKTNNFCRCEYGGFLAEACVKCVASGNCAYVIHGWFQDRNSMLELVEIGYQHKIHGFDHLQFQEGSFLTTSERNTLQQFYDLGYYRIARECTVKNANE